jgi:hypothetical protein
MDEIYEIIKAFNRLEEKVNSLNAKIDLLLKSPFKNMSLDSNAVCKLLSISLRSLYKLRTSGAICYFRANRKILYPASEVLKYLRKTSNLGELDQLTSSLKDKNYGNN